MTTQKSLDIARCSLEGRIALVEDPYLTPKLRDGTGSDQHGEVWLLQPVEDSEM